jgi:hypothetical protein
MRFRVFTTLAVLVASVGLLAVGVSTAAAKGSGVVNPTNYNYAADPQTTNIPWVAWAGETVKVTRCFGLGDSQVGQQTYEQSSFNHGVSVIGEFDKSDWSGATDQPPFFQIGTGDETSRQVQPTWDINGGVCFSTNVTSEKAGLERIKFSISVDFGRWLASLGQDVIFQQDLYVIWMWDSNPVLTEAGDTGAYKVGDPGGSGTFDPIADSNGYKTLQPGLLSVQVTGTFPMGNDFAGYDFTGTALGNGTITLPTDWPWLANHFAEDYTLGSTYPGSTPLRWDIHDDDTNAEGHVLASNCNTDIGLTESVDNCNGASGYSPADPDLGPFSSIFGLVGTDNDAYGPFDPIRSFETLLSDGNLNADDAPMPALRVDVSLTNAGSDHSVGTLSKADKSAIFNRNPAEYGGNTTDLGDPHQLYAPFYKAYVPAVVPIIDLNSTSGVEGSIGGNYSNWLTSFAYGPNNTSEDDPFIYDYWDTFKLDDSGGTNDCYGVDGNKISQPDGWTAVAVYTDEHGQAYVQFNPANSEDGEGIVLDQSPYPDANGRCDVYGGSLVGTATIQAESVYPAQQPADPGNSGKPKLSALLTKTVDFTPSKVLTCLPKGPNEAYCVETVTDFEGNPIKADVEFTTQVAGGSNASTGPEFNPFMGYDPSGQVVETWNSDFIDLHNDPDTGQAAIYVHSSIDACVDVTVENWGTRNGGAGITRDFDFNPHTGVACGDNTGTGGSGSGGTGGTGGTGGGTGGTGGAAVTATSTAAPVSVSSPAPTVTAATTPKVAQAIKMTLVSARVVSTRSGRFLNARVNSSAKFATLRITLVGKNGKSHIVLRKVATNRVVRVANLKLAPSVKTVRVAIA